MYVAYLLKIQYCQRNLLISIIIFVHFVVYLILIFMCNLVYETKSLVVFFRVLSNFVVYLLILSLFIRLFNIDLNSKSLNIIFEFF